MKKKLEYGTKVVFTIKKRKYEYSIAVNHLTTLTGHLTNSAIFRALGMNTLEERSHFCSECYGYPCGRGGEWPTFAAGDYNAAQRCIDRLHELCLLESHSETASLSKNMLDAYLKS